MNSPYIRLFSGKKFHILEPKPSEIDIEDIAHNLSQLCRYTGATRIFYSIAEHACRVCDMLPDELKLEGLCHDNSEAYICDLSSPLKSCLPQYKEIELKIEKVIARKFKLKFPFPAGIKIADMTLLVTEMRDLMPANDYKTIPFTPLTDKIEPWSMSRAHEEFVKRYKIWARK